MCKRALRFEKRNKYFDTIQNAIFKIIKRGISEHFFVNRLHHFTLVNLVASRTAGHTKASVSQPQPYHLLTFTYLFT